MPTNPEHTMPIEDDTTEPNPVVRRDQTIPADQLEIATDVDILKNENLSGAMTPKGITPAGITPATPPPSSMGDPVVALAKPKPGKGASFVDRKYRLPTESEIKAAVEGTPTDQVPVIDALD
jgi:hypothetical protein